MSCLEVQWLIFLKIMLIVNKLSSVHLKKFKDLKC